METNVIGTVTNVREVSRSDDCIVLVFGNEIEAEEAMEIFNLKFRMGIRKACYNGYMNALEIPMSINFSSEEF